MIEKVKKLQLLKNGSKEKVSYLKKSAGKGKRGINKNKRV